MTAQVSTVSQMTQKRSEFSKYFLYKLDRLKFIIILCCTLAFFTYPFDRLLYDSYIQAKLADINTPPSADGSMTEAHLALRQLEGTRILSEIICYLCIAALGIVTLWAIKDTFRYLGSRKYLNMDMSLPVSHRTRFIADTLVSFAVTFIPCGIAALIGHCIMAHTTTLNFGGEDWLRTDVMEMCQNKENQMLMLLAAFFLLYALSLFCMSFCGRNVECIVIPVLMNVAIPASLMLIYNTAVSACYGATQNTLVTADFLPLSVTSPLGFMYGFFGRPLKTHIYILALLYAAALVVGSYFVQKHRRNERVGSAFVFRFARPVFLGICVLGITAFFTWKLFPAKSAELRAVQNTESVSPTLYIVLLAVSTLVFYVAGELICGADIKKLPKILLKYAATAGVCLLICTMSTFTGGFGFSSYIPPAEDVEYASISYWNYGDTISASNIPYEKVAALHKKILEDDLRFEPDSDTAYASLYLTYFAVPSKAESTDRCYYIDDRYTEEIYRMCLDGYSYFTGEMYDIAGERSFTDNDPSCCVFINDGSGIGTADHEIRTDITFDELQAALDEDRKLLTFERLYKTAYEPAMRVNVRTGNASRGTWVQSFEIYPFFDSTLSLLREHGIELYDYRQEMTAAYLVKATKDQGYAESTMSGTVLMQHYNRESSEYNTQLRKVDIGSPEFKELWGDVANMTMYSSHGDRYWLCVIYASRYSPDGADPRDSFYAEYYPVTENNAARAAELAGSLEEATFEDLDNSLNPYES